jgi:hypothetical protein
MWLCLSALAGLLMLSGSGYGFLAGLMIMGAAAVALPWG